MNQKKTCFLIFLFHLFLFSSLLGAAPAPGGEKSPSEAAHEQNYRIGIGDLLQVEVYGEADLTKEVRVLTDETISFPLLGTLKAGGLTVGQLEQDIKQRLGEKYLVNPQVTVFVKEFSRVYVLGEVKSPGSFPLSGKMTVFEAVTQAGGLTDVANPSKVKVIRQENGKEVSFTVNLEKVIKNGDTSEDKELKANDRVVIPRSFF